MVKSIDVPLGIPYIYRLCFTIYHFQSTCAFIYFIIFFYTFYYRKFNKLLYTILVLLYTTSLLFLYARLQTGRIMVWWCPSVRPSVRISVRPSVRHSFPHFSPTCFDILIWNFVYHFIFMHVRSSSNAINFRHFLQELCSFLTSNSYKYAVFRTFLLHALTYWVQILYMTLF